MEAQGRPRTLPDAEMDPQRLQMGGQWEPKGVQRLAKESRREGKMEPGSEYKGNRTYETNLRKPKENEGFQWSEEPGGAETEAKMEPWEIRAEAREPWAPPSGQC